MKKYKHLFAMALLVIISFPFSCPARAAGVPQEVLSASDSVVYIEVETSTEISSGSGFVIKNDPDSTLIATNHHVIASNTNGIFVWVGENDKRSASIVADSEEYDLTILRLSEPISVKALPLSAQASQGEEVFAIGYPAAANSLSSTEAHLGTDATITNGIISSIRKMKNVDYGPEIQLLQINAGINAGNSGGPLLNSNGEVVGINTYGVLDSQGIYGAISATELIEFAGRNNQDIGEAQQTSSFPILIYGYLLALALITFLLIFFLKIKRKGRMKLSKELPLAEYLAKLGRPLDAYAAVSLLMPVLLRLRDMHNQGVLCLKLSPANLCVSKSGCVLRASSAFISDQFVAPEQRAGNFAGVKADIYSMCAVLKFLLGNTAASQTAASEPSAAAELERIVEKGLSSDPSKRFSNMQELILALSPFNSGLPEYALTPFKHTGVLPERPKHPIKYSRVLASIAAPKSKKRVVLLIVGSVIAVLCGLFGFFAINYASALRHAKAYDFQTALTQINRIPLGQRIFARDYCFIDSGSKMLARNYDAALETIAPLNGYDGASDLELEIQYRRAAMLADEKQFDEAIKQYKEIITYKDSNVLINDTTFKMACYYLDAEEDYPAALEILQELSENGYPDASEKIAELYYVWGQSLIAKKDYLAAYTTLLAAGNYMDAAQIVEELKGNIYYSAIDYYHQGSYAVSKRWFQAIGNYLSSDEYLLLINAHNSTSVSSSRLEELIGFEDAAEILMSSSTYADSFLLGLWTDGSMYFNMDQDDSVLYNIPHDAIGSYYIFENGVIYSVSEEDLSSSSGKKMLKISVISKDCIQIYAYKNGQTYVLIRQ